MTATIVLSLLVVAMAPAAFAAPRDEALSRAADVKREVDELDEQTEILSEEYNAARERHADLVEQERAAAQRLKETTERTDLLQARLSTRAQSLYRNGRSGFIEVILGVSDFEAFAQTWDILQRINQEDARTIEELKAAKAEQAQASRVLEERAAQAAAELTVLATRQADIEAM
jgi:peptidoglycan hydrolase CwlO-like protein